MPFVSKSQARACYSKGDPDWNCSEWSEHTPSIKALPERKKKKKAKKAKKATTVTEKVAHVAQLLKVLPVDLGQLFVGGL